MNAASVYAALASILIGPLVAYIVATRRLSGKITTSEASELWKESSSIRDDYRERLRRSDDLLMRLEDRVRLLEASNDELRTENVKLRRRVEELTVENAALHTEIAQLRRTMEDRHE